jgi:hypothetical protein
MRKKRFVGSPGKPLFVWADLVNLQDLPNLNHTKIAKHDNRNNNQN